MILDEKTNVELIDVVIPELYQTSQPHATFKKGITAPRRWRVGEKKVLSYDLFKSFFSARTPLWLSHLSRTSHQGDEPRPSETYE